MLTMRSANELFKTQAMATAPLKTPIQSMFPAASSWPNTKHFPDVLRTDTNVRLRWISPEFGAKIFSRPHFTAVELECRTTFRLSQ